jgi:hypothetical protein
MGWIDAWLDPATEEKLAAAVPPVNEGRLERLWQAMYLHQGEWEMEFFMFPLAFGDQGQRPYFPYSWLCLDRGSSLMLTAHMAAPTQLTSEFQEQIDQIIEPQKMAPQTVDVCRKEAKELLKPNADRLANRAEVNTGLAVG